MTESVKFIAGNFKYPVELERQGNKIYVHMQYNKTLIDEIKCMEGARYHGYDEENPRKVWSITDTQRNKFQLKILQGDYSPYARYDKTLADMDRVKKFNIALGREVNPYGHQFEIASHIFTRQQCIVAGEMGTGKSLGWILAAEAILKTQGWDDWWVVSNKAGIRAFYRELTIWQANVKPQLKTYEQVVKDIANWREGDKAPRGILFDESSKVKNPGAKRSQAAYHLANSARDDHGTENTFVVLMSGSPAPRSPADWWFQCEIACPGFLREGNIEKFKSRLAVIVQKENVVTGGVYPQLVTWRDDENKCNVCGEAKDSPNHDPMKQLISTDSNPPHDYVKSKNEIVNLYERMKGLVLVKFKKDVLKELPEKQYRIIPLTPRPDTLRAAQLIVDSAPSALQALTLLRELSDGFQYKRKQNGERACPICFGNKTSKQQFPIIDSCPDCKGKPSDEQTPKACFTHNPKFEEKEAPCTACAAKGVVPTFIQESVEVPCPKEDLLKELLDDHEDVGRFVVFAGFTGSIDRCVRVCQDSDWTVIRVDSRGWTVLGPKGVAIEGDPLSIFQDKAQREKFPKVCFVAHPKSGGMAVTLTESPSIFYYSNSFDGEDRIQSEDRIHRPGMDVNKGATIIDCVHLSSDQRILDNIKIKRDLQSMSLGELKESMASSAGDRR